MITSKADLDDQRWLEQRITDVEYGIEAVLDIYRNWTENRNLSRLHGGDAFVYIKDHVAQFGLGRKAVPALIEGTNLSFSAIAQLTGASVMTVTRDAETFPDVKVEERVGADGAKGRTGRPRKPKPEPEPPVSALEGEVIEDEEVMEPEGTHLERWTDLYIRRLSKHIDGVVKLAPPPYPPDGAQNIARRRHELNRRLQAVLREVMG